MNLEPSRSERAAQPIVLIPNIEGSQPSIVIIQLFNYQVVGAYGIEPHFSEEDPFTADPVPSTNTPKTKELPGLFRVALSLVHLSMGLQAEGASGILGIDAFHYTPHTIRRTYGTRLVWLAMVVAGIGLHSVRQGLHDDDDQIVALISGFVKSVPGIVAGIGLHSVR